MGDMDLDLNKELRAIDVLQDFIESRFGDFVTIKQISNLELIIEPKNKDEIIEKLQEKR